LYTSKSLLGNIWKLKSFDERETLMISQRHNISPLLAKLLNIRDIKEVDIENYLNPDLNNDLPDPFLFKDMKKSVERTSEALLKNQIIGIIADYDVDGSTSAAILCKFFNSLNKNIILKIPDRLKDGYGPNIRIMKEMLLYKVNLLFTLDCGTSSFGILDQSIYKTIDTIVIDHHISEHKLPKVFSIINPNRFDENIRFKDFAAVGVTFMFLLALRKYLRKSQYFKMNNIKEPNLLSLLDLVALGTVCDVVNLKNYNRALIKKGIEILHKRKNKGIAKIIDNSKINKSLTVSDLGYIIGPQLNAASRIDDSTLPSKILTSENIIEIESIARKLFILNEKRKLIEINIYEKAIEQIKNQSLNNVIIVKGKNWHLGVLGIVASKIVEKFNKPAIAISYNNNYGIGSARSIANIDLGNIILKAKQQGLLLSGGGHKMAAGLKISKDLIADFENYIIDYFEKFDSSFFQKIIFYDSTITLDEINLKLIENIEKMEPFGNENPEPKFIVKNVYFDHAKIIKEKHILLFIKNNYNINLKAICFNSVGNQLGENLLKGKSKKFDVACSVRKNNFQENLQPQIIVHDAILMTN
jgi:single-stranded-DNA-specific exonuclease